MTPHDANTGRRASKTVGPSEREKDDSGFFLSRAGLDADLIFVTYITNIISGEKIVVWRNFSFPCMTIVGKLKISPHVEKFQMSPDDRCEEI